MIYKLSQDGRKLTYAAWRKLGGCGIPNMNSVFITLGPIAHWDKNLITLGDIEDACPATGRDFARFAVQNLNKPLMAVPYDRLAQI